MISAAQIKNSRLTAYAGLIAGWMALGYSDKAPEMWRTPMMIAGGLLFAWSWMKVSPCAGGRCEIPKK